MSSPSKNVLSGLRRCVVIDVPVEKNGGADEGIGRGSNENVEHSEGSAGSDQGVVHVRLVWGPGQLQAVVPKLGLCRSVPPKTTLFWRSDCALVALIIYLTDFVHCAEFLRCNSLTLTQPA